MNHTLTTQHTNQSNSPIPLHVNHSLNKKGIDYFVGDIHGYYDLLIDRLNEIGFKPHCDRLFSTGDLIDRGPDSLSCVRLIDQPWFFAVRGNHEDMLLSASKISEENAVYKHWFSYSKWFLEPTMKPFQSEILERLGKMPYFRTIKTEDATFGLVHAAWEGSWLHAQTKTALTDKEIGMAIWLRFGHDNFNHIDGVDWVVCGHQNVETPVKVANFLCIDTVLRASKLTIFSTDELLEMALH